jgi:predicted amidohydrolase YtcJ
MAMDERADILFLRGHVWTGVDGRAPVDTVAVRNGRILGVGTQRDLDWATGPGTRVIPLGGRLLLPGFQDAHVHPVLAGVARQGCLLHGLPDVDAYLDAITAFAGEHPDRPWIMGEGWSQSLFPDGLAQASLLDAVVPGRPVAIESADGHSMWVNSMALSAARITAATPDPKQGRVERYLDGSPLGTLHESAMELLKGHTPEPTPTDLEEGLRWAQAELHRLGITAWQDAHVTPPREAAYLALAGRGHLTARTSVSLLWDTDRGLDQLPELVARRETIRLLGGRRVRAVAIKLFADGVVENRSAALLEPYLDERGLPGTDRGGSVFPPRQLREICIALDELGFAIHVHAIGDRAVRESLDAIAAARSTNGPRDARHNIAHVQLVHPGDMPRFPALGVIANCQPYWAFEDEDVPELSKSLLGADRSQRQYPFASLLRSGATLAFGSDWSVSTPDPLQLIEVAIQRTNPARRDQKPLGRHERLTPEAALRGVTRGAAQVNWTDDETGTITIGKAADLVLLDRDPLGIDAGPFGDARVLMTLVDGRPVWEDPGLGA